MTKLTGIVCPLLTPFNDDGTVAVDLWVAHAKWVLDQGAHYLSPFGTTGEALSLSRPERMDALEHLIQGGIPANRLMPGTGMISRPDTQTLSGHANDLGCAAVMVLPSFYFKLAGDDGQYRYFSEMIDDINDPNLKIILYNIPQLSGVAVSPGLAARLNAAYPETVVAYKDSAGDWEHTKAVIAAAPDIAVFPGFETSLADRMAQGTSGTISATTNLNAAAIRAVYDKTVAGQETPEGTSATDRFRATLQNHGLIKPMKAVLSLWHDEPRWLNLRAPHLNARPEQGQAMLDDLGEMIAHIVPQT